MAAVVFMLVISGSVGRKTGVISGKYNTIATPPGGFFAIWGLIYLGLIIAGIYNLVANTWSLGVTVIFTIGAILNGLWIYIFNFSSSKANNLCAIVLLSMVILNEIQWIWM